MKEKAIDFVRSVFSGVTDKGGAPYIEHCLAVMKGVNHMPEHVQIAALLHDVVEDTNYTVNDISIAYGNQVAELVELLTKIPGQTYQEYITGIKANKEAISIKISDLTHNMNVTRLKEITDTDLARLKKYHKTYRDLVKTLNN